MVQKTIAEDMPELFCMVPGSEFWEHHAKVVVELVREIPFRAAGCLPQITFKKRKTKNDHTECAT